MDHVFTAQAPMPGGHYSQAVTAGGFVFVSGMLPVRLHDDDPDGDDFEAQCRRALGHCERVLVAAGCTLGHVVQCVAYIVGIEHWSAFNRVYAEAFGMHRPARAVVPVPELHHGYLVELQMIAHRR